MPLLNGAHQDSTRAKTCEWCGTTGSAVCSSLSNSELRLFYLGGTNQTCNQETWKHRRDLFKEEADLVV